MYKYTNITLDIRIYTCIKQLQKNTEAREVVNLGATEVFYVALTDAVTLRYKINKYHLVDQLLNSSFLF